MGNPYKGEVQFTAGGKSYTLYFSINAMCELEEALGDGIVQLASPSRRQQAQDQGHPRRFLGGPS